MLCVIVEKRLKQQCAELNVLAGELQSGRSADPLVSVFLGGIGTLGEVKNRHRKLADYGAAEGCIIVLIGSLVLVKEAVDVPVVDFNAPSFQRYTDEVSGKVWVFIEIHLKCGDA